MTATFDGFIVQAHVRWGKSNGDCTGLSFHTWEVAGDTEYTTLMTGSAHPIHFQLYDASGTIAYSAGFTVSCSYSGTTPSWVFISNAVNSLGFKGSGAGFTDEGNTATTHTGINGAGTPTGTLPQLACGIESVATPADRAMENVAGSRSWWEGCLVVWASGAIAGSKYMFRADNDGTAFGRYDNYAFAIGSSGAGGAPTTIPNKIMDGDGLSWVQTEFSS